MVMNTPDRSRFWEIQTPQALQRDLLAKGLALAEKAGITVTDDTSLAELVGGKAQIVRGSYRNIKVTTPEDFVVAEQLHV
jgi:2-C-methyl-D-erythritol 4-phosphate cytidylyltransferase